MSWKVSVASGHRTLVSASLGEDARLRDVDEPDDPMWRTLLRALVREFQDDPDLATWIRTKDRGAPEIWNGHGPKRKTHCKRGHELSAENVYLFTNHKTGVERRSCRPCMLESARRRDRLRTLRAWHGPCPSCGQIHNPDEVSEACINAMEEARQAPAALKVSA